MPRYDMECNSCSHEFEATLRVDEVDKAFCPKCCEAARVVFKVAPKKDWFKPHWNPNFDIEPIYVESKRHYKDLCKKYDVTSRAL